MCEDHSPGFGRRFALSPTLDDTSDADRECRGLRMANLVGEATVGSVESDRATDTSRETSAVVEAEGEAEDDAESDEVSTLLRP